MTMIAPIVAQRAINLTMRPAGGTGNVIVLERLRIRTGYDLRHELDPPSEHGGCPEAIARTGTNASYDTDADLSQLPTGGIARLRTNDKKARSSR